MLQAEFACLAYAEIAQKQMGASNCSGPRRGGLREGLLLFAWIELDDKDTSQPTGSDYLCNI